MKIKQLLKNNFKLYAVMAVIIILGTIGITYALTIGNFNTIAVNTTASVIDANITYDDGTNDAQIINNGNMFPIDDALVIGPNVTDTRVLKAKFNVSGVDANPEDTIYDIAMYFDTLDCELRTTDLKWRLYKNDSLLSEGSLSPTFDTINNNRLVLTNTQEDLTATTDKYTFLLWISESCTGDITECDSSMDQSVYLNRSLSGSIKVELSTKTKKTLTRITGEEGSCSYLETAVPVCNNLTYNGSSQTLVNDTSASVLGISTGGYSYSVMPLGVSTIADTNSYTIENNTGTNAGQYPVILKLNDGYKWSDGSTADKCIYCSIAKKNVEITTLDQTIKYGNSISSSSDYINSDGLLEEHNIGTYTLVSSIYDVGVGTISANNVKIVDSFSNDVTNNYDIKYNKGSVYVNCLNTATSPSINDKKYNGEEQVGISGGSYINISGATKATEVGSYVATATPQKNYCWNDGTTSSKEINWKILSDVIIINLDNQSADSTGTSSIYSKNDKVCLDESCNNVMSTSANQITVPSKAGYTFGGYYTGLDGTGTQMITNTGYATSDMTSTAYSEDTTLYAYWIVNSYTITCNYKYYYNGVWQTYSTSYLTKNYGSKIYPTGDVSITGFTYNGKFEYYDSNGNYLGEGTNGMFITVTGDMTVNVLYMPNEYTVTYNSGNLIHSLYDVDTTTAGSKKMQYSVSNGTVTVTALTDDGYGVINGRVYLEAGRTYIFNCDSSGTFGDGSSQTEAYLMLNGDYDDIIHLVDNSDYNFTPTVSGEYYLRLDVNVSGETHTFSNISITTDLGTKTVTYSNSYGAAPSISLEGYTVNKWYTTLGRNSEVAGTSLVTTAGNHTVYGNAAIKKAIISYFLRNGETLQYESVSDSEGTNYFDTDTRGYIYRNDEMIQDVLNYGSILPGDGLYNYNNSSLMNITKTGYTAVEEAEWISTNLSTNKTYSQTIRHSYFDFCDSTSDGCNVTLSVNWRLNTVNIRYNTNGGSIVGSNSTDDDYYTSNSSGLVYLNGEILTTAVNYGKSLGSTGLMNYDNSSALEIERTTYDAVGGSEWKCLEGDCAGKTYNHASVYNASDFCDASSGDCTVTLGVNWELNSVTIYYDLNGGSFGTTTSSYTFTSDSNEIIYQNGSILTQTISYGGQLGSNTLRNYNNSASLNIVRTGHTAPDGAEWKCLSGCTTVGTTYDHDAMYYDEDFCDLTQGDCTVVLGVNWKPNTVSINYNVNGGTIRAETTTTDGYYSAWTTDSNGLVYRNDNLWTHTVNYGGKLSTTTGLQDYNNANSMYITRTGYYVSTSAVWKCLSGCTGARTTYNQTSAYAASDFCDASAGDCTVVLGVNWLPRSYNLTYDYDHSYYYSRPDYMDTGYTINWDTDFTIKETFYVPSSGYRYMIISNYNASDKNALSIEITSANLLRVYFGTGQVDSKSSTAITLKEYIDIVFTWDASESAWSITATGDTTDISYSGTKAMSGISATTLRIGTVDNRGSSNVFWKISTSNLKITSLVPYTTQLSNLPNVTDTVDSFGGWYTGTDGSGTKITTSSTMPANAVTYYAYWTGTATASLSAYSDGSASTISYNGMNNFNNYIPSFIGTYNNSKVVMIDNNSDKTYYMSGEVANRPITFRLTGEPIENVAYIEYCIDTTNTCTPNIKYTKEETVTKNSYIRYRAVSNSGTVEATKSFHALVSSSNSTYTVSYNANGGTGAPNSQVKNHGESVILSNVQPIREGYEFLGWSINKEATSATYGAGSVYTNNIDTTLYAIWSKK